MDELSQRTMQWNTFLDILDVKQQYVYNQWFPSGPLLFTEFQVHSLIRLTWRSAPSHIATTPAEWRVNNPDLSRLRTRFDTLNSTSVHRTPEP